MFFGVQKVNAGRRDHVISFSKGNYYICDKDVL